VKAQVAQVYPLEDIKQAFSDGQTGHARGKRVLQIVT
jgi:D-arabinose 1-dehydrogenase-like Zn-dependent alcohol dehydrogenase